MYKRQGVISSTFMSTLSPGMHISVPSGRVMMPVTSVVRTVSYTHLIPLTLEEIFIYELGGADYAVRDIVPVSYTHLWVVFT